MQMLHGLAFEYRKHAKQDVAAFRGLVGVRRSPGDKAPDAITSADVEADLARRSLLKLPFSSGIEARYEADTKAARAWNIRLTVPMGLMAYLAFSLVDGSILPDLGWLPVACRLGLITPVGLFAMWMCTRLGAGFREAFISYAITGTMIFPVGFIGFSHAPLAPYTMMVVLLVSMFGNITMRLRFHWACLFTATTIVSVGGMLLVKPGLPDGIALHIFIATITCLSFGIVANNQLERAERRSYLLALREMLRSEQLSVDRAVFSALSLVDPLTGLANRRAFDAKLEELWGLRQRNERPFCVLMLDVDFFKQFNDQYGHPAGDACLKCIADVIREIVIRPQDLAVRYGGEEFAVLLADCDLRNGTAIAERVRQGVEKAAIAHGSRDDGRSRVSVSIGVAVSAHPSDDTASDIVAQADRNLYSAKRAGRNRVVSSLLRPPEGC